MVTPHKPMPSLANGCKRSGFTLIELLVVIAIIMALAAITLLFFPKRQVRLAADGADKLQTYIAQARSRALRDQAPRGVRLLPDSNGKLTQIVLVEVPDPIVPPTGTTMTVGVPVAAFSTANFTFPAGTDLGSLGIQTGDFLEIMYGSGSIHRISGFSGTTGVTLVSKVPAAEITQLKLTDNFRFIRQARPLMGEPSLNMPDTVFVMGDSSSDTVAGSRNLPPANNGISGSVEIIFSPSGQVINSSSGRIVLWVTDDNGVSKPTLLTVYTRTGAVAAHPAGPAADLFAYTKDGRSSGQ